MFGNRREKIEHALALFFQSDKSLAGVVESRCQVVEVLRVPKTDQDIHVHQTEYLTLSFRRVSGTKAGASMLFRPSRRLCILGFVCEPRSREPEREGEDMANQGLLPEYTSISGAWVLDLSRWAFLLGD